MAKQGLIIGSDLSRHYRKSVFIKGVAGKFPCEVVDVENEHNLWRFFKTLWKVGRKKDFILVMQPAQFFVWPTLLFRLFFKKTIIFDTHISILDTFIGDRGLAPKFSLKAVYYYLLDFLSCWISDILVFDTADHRDYFAKTFRINPKKPQLVVPVCVDIDFIDQQRANYERQPKPVKTKFDVVFFGLFIPLQGVEFIIGAADLLKDDPDIQFTLIGSGQTKKAALAQVEKLNLDNVSFVNRVSYQELFPYIFGSDVCLGIFGKTDKANRVIPNKLIESMASGKVTITGANPEIASAFKDGEELILCKMASAEDLAEKIEMIKNDPQRFSQMGTRASEKIRNYHSQKSLDSIYLEPLVKLLADK